MGEGRGLDANFTLFSSYTVATQRRDKRTMRENNRSVVRKIFLLTLKQSTLFLKRPEKMIFCFQT